MSVVKVTIGIGIVSMGIAGYMGVDRKAAKSGFVIALIISAVVDARGKKKA